MNEASLLPKHVLVRTLLVCTICTLLCSISIQSVKANGAPPPDPTVGGASPYQPQKTNVQMMAETVFIDVPQSPSNAQEPKQISVNAVFTMRNQGKTEEQMQVIFPLTRLNTWQNEEALYEIDISSFAVKVNGQSVPFTTVTTPPEMTVPDTEHDGFLSQVKWAGFEVTFPVQKDVLLQVEYEMINPYEYEAFTGIAYILETGAGWYGSILSAEIIVRLPYQMEEAALYYAKPGYVISGRELRWTLKDLEPTRDDNLAIRVVEAGRWQAIVDLRSKVKQNPKDADAWAKLANGYESLAIFYSLGHKEHGFPYTLNQRTSDLAVEARRKVVELRPDWGEAHFWLAEILWYTNPAVEKIWGEWTGTLGSIQPNDPSIQEVLHELELAWSYGLSDNMSWDEEYLVEMINRTVPGLQLVPPGAPTITATIATATETLAPTATNTPLPTASPTIVPSASPTPISTEAPSDNRNNVLLVVALGLLMASGIYIFRWKSK